MGELDSYLKGTGQQRILAEDALSWGIEISLDVETVHAVCPACRITLVEASSEDNESLFTAERTAESLNPASITNSWGSIEESGSADAQAPFDDTHTVITAAAGDEGYLSWYRSFENCEARSEYGPNCQLEYAAAPYFPASSPDVVSVGGTRLKVSASGQREEETVWNGQGAGGSGCSTMFDAPSWQREAESWGRTGCGEHRAVADVAAVGDPYTGLAVYNSSSYCETTYPNSQGRMETQHWCTIGGTSLASPLIAAAYALAGGNNGAEYPARYIYENARQNPGSLHDITRGSNGGCNFALIAEEGLASCETSYEAEACGGLAICTAGPGYDGPTGVGTINGLAALRPLGAPVLHGPNSGGRVIVRRVALTASAARSLRRGRARSLSLSLTVSGSGALRLRLYRMVRRHHRNVWVRAASRTIDVHGGANTARLRTGKLRRGRYRILAAALRGGSSRSATFSVR
jgi:subtilase family serine protease